MEINQLMVAEVESLSQEQLDFRSLHCEIIRAGNMAADACIMYAYKFKEMRDSKKYRAVGCETFGEYCKTVCNLNERQIYNYISVVEKLDNSILQTSALSMSKLITLASMSGTERAELLDEHDMADLETMSSRELEKVKAEHESRVQQLTMDIEVVDKENNVLRADVSKLKLEPTELKKELDKINLERDSFASESKKLAAEIKTIESTPREGQKEVDAESDEKLKTAEQNLEKAQEQLKQSSLDYDKLAKKLEIASDDTMIKFSLKFNDLQNIGIELMELLGEMPKEKKEKCISAISNVTKEWQV